MSLLGVNNINNLKECTGVLPLPVTSFTNPDQALLTKFLAGTLQNQAQAATQLQAGQVITGP